VASLTEEQKMEIREYVSRILEQSAVPIVTAAEKFPRKRKVFFSCFQPPAPEAQSIEPLVQVIARAVEVLGSSEKALRWINAPIRSLGDQTPVSLLSTPEGIARVEDALGRIEHGVW
jgi:putative toxin-antitoxin system antitoxin component (TIGR02293 family)